jgi:DNA modification methylase
VKDGRLEFVNGGWVASDEACPTFEDFIMNILTGNAFLKKEFDIVPKIAWHCDPFGHSAVTPELFAKMGYEALFFARVDDDEKAWRKQT